VDLLVLKELFI